MLKIISFLILFLVSCAKATEPLKYDGKFEAVYFSESESIQKRIKINFLDESKCKIVIINGNEIYDEGIYRYVRKGNWVMIKNMSTGKWTRFEYRPVDQNTFQLKIFEVDSLQKWRVFHKQKAS